MNFLGIDVGTGGTRALVIDPSGRILGSATSEHVPFATPRPGWAEQDPADWWRATGEAVPGALADAGIDSAGIAAVGFSGQMHGSTLLDDTDRVVRPALLWCDQRTGAECDAITATVGAARLIELTLNPALTGFTLPKLLWVRRHEPESWARVRSVLLPKDYVRFRLTGDRATDVADASGTLLFDVANRRWSAEVAGALGIDLTLLPRAFESPEVTGTVSAAGASATGLRAGTPVVAGGGDQAAGAVGMGIVEAGLVSATIGTSGVVFAATSKPALDPKGRVHTFCHAVPGMWHVMGVTQGAGLSLRWLRDMMGGGLTYDKLCEAAAGVPPGCDGARWTPYLMGERTPHLDPHARAALAGLTASHTRGHLVRAVLEGVTFSLQDSFAIFAEMGVPVNGVRLGGGGAKSPLWRQVQADVYGHTAEIVEAEEGAAYGAAILAGVGAGAWPSVDGACKAIVKVATRVPPNPVAVAALRAVYADWRRVYPALKGIGATDPVAIA
jgi:xylulokinase